MSDKVSSNIVCIMWTEFSQNMCSVISMSGVYDYELNNETTNNRPARLAVEK